MKYLIQMNKFVRISTVAVVLCVAMIGGSLVYKHGTAHACGSSIVSGSTTTFVFIDYNNTFVHITFSLWYNSFNDQNFASANITRGSYSSLEVDVTRNAGPDGGPLEGNNSNCPSKGVCTSSGVYSPDNTSSAEIALNNGDFVFTSSF